MKPELVAPAGSYEAFEAAIRAGCDAVYLGGLRFSARAGAANFTRELLERALDKAHILGKKVYYTANTLIKESEMNLFMQEIEFLYTQGIDAIILQDMGAFHWIKSQYPDLPLHASTQCTVHSLKGVQELERLGFLQVVLSRELSLEEIINIKKETRITLECFIHGALCYSYSGQCLMSSLIGGRSGNRGTCAQPCRLPYQVLRGHERHEGYLLSPKDIETISILPRLIEAGIHSFKIEGRMKSPEYVWLITSLYRKYIDLFCENPEEYRVQKNDLKSMNQIFNRGGFSNGYYFSQNGKEMISRDNPKHQGILVGQVHSIVHSGKATVSLSEEINQGNCLEIRSRSSAASFIAKKNMNGPRGTVDIPTKGISPKDTVYQLTDIKLLNNYQQSKSHEPKIPLQCFFKAVLGEKMCLTIQSGTETISSESSFVEGAKTSPASRDQIIKHLMKTGNEQVFMDSVTLEVDENVFLSIKDLNDLRRNAIGSLLRQLTASKKRENHRSAYKPTRHSDSIQDPTLSVLIRSMEQFEIACGFRIETIYVEIAAFSKKELFNLANQAQKNKLKTIFALPRIMRDSRKAEFEEKCSLAKEVPVQGFCIRTLDGLSWVPEGMRDIIADYSINAMNNSSIDFWTSRGISYLTASVELNKKEMAHLECSCFELVVYGYLPIITSSQCVDQTADRCCPKPGSCTLTDRKGVHFAVKKDCNLCLNTIYNSVPLFLMDQFHDLSQLGYKRFRIELLDESPEEIRRILSMGANMIKGLPVKGLHQNTYTRGHYTRGVL